MNRYMLINKPVYIKKLGNVMEKLNLKKYIMMCSVL